MRRPGAPSGSVICAWMLNEVSTTAGSYIRPAPLDEDRDRLLVRQLAAVGTIRGERVEAVDDGEDAGADRDVLAGDAVRVPAAVPALVVAAHDRHDGKREIDEREDVRAHVHVFLHLLELGVGEPAGLVEDALGHGELAGVVQQRGGLDRLERRLVADAEGARERAPRRPGRGARGCGSRRPSRRSPSRAFRPWTGRADRPGRGAAWCPRGGRDDARSVWWNTATTGRITATASAPSCCTTSTRQTATDADAR